MKKILSLLLVVTLLLCGMVYAQEETTDRVKININGTYFEPSFAPLIEDGRVLVPLRSIGEALNSQIKWMDEEKAVMIFDGVELTVLWIGKDSAFKTDGLTLTGFYKMDVCAKIVDGHTMVPVRCVSELLGAEVLWDDKSKTVLIDYKSNGILLNEGDIDAIDPVYVKAFTSLYDTYRDYSLMKANVTKVKMELEIGTVKLELYNDLAPKTVENFINLAEKGSFDGRIFHRVIKDFMIQGGIADQNLNGESTEPIVGEFLANGYFNLLPHERGFISMARSSDPNSASNQFFIVHKDSPHLNGYYAAFGKVTEGMEYIDKIAECETDENDMPKVNQVIKSVKIVK